MLGFWHLGDMEVKMPERETTWLESQILEPRLHSFEELVCFLYQLQIS